MPDPGPEERKARFPAKQKAVGPACRLLVDGNNLGYMCAHVGKAQSFPMGAAHLFLSKLRQAFDIFHPCRCEVMWDTGNDPYRVALLPTYKGARQQKRDPLEVRLRSWATDNMEWLRTVLGRLGVWQYQCVDGPGEADDILYLRAITDRDRYSSTIILSTDKDLSQLLTPEDPDDYVKDTYHRVYRCRPDRGHIGEGYVGLTDGADLYHEFGWWPADFVLALSVMGDDGDGIGGINGVGPKTVERLLEHYGSFPKVLELLDDVAQQYGRAHILNTTMGLDLLSRNVQLITLRPPTFMVSEVPACLPRGLGAAASIGFLVRELTDAILAPAGVEFQEFVRPFMELAERGGKHALGTCR